MADQPTEGEMADSVELVRGALRDLITRSHLSLRSLDTRFGLGKNFFSNVFSGRKELRVAHVYMVLEAAGCSPAEFWASIHGFHTPEAPRGTEGVYEDDARLNALIESKVAEALKKLKPQKPKAATSASRRRARRV